LVHELDPGQPLFNVRTIEDLYEMRAVKLADVITQTVGSMGLMGLALAVVGLYGLVAYSISRRTREIAIRVALGARRKEVLAVVLRRSAVLVCSGTGAGLIASLGAGRFLQGMFSNTFTPSATVLICLSVSIALLVVTMIAAYLPARRALRIDPMVALRYD
jgi:ABC-type antimicrobial peptide transport system permease subunit